MKKVLALTLTACLCVTSVMAAGHGECETEDWLDEMADNMGRGFVNTLTFWLEMPRNMWYDGTRNAYFGLLPGIVDGACLTSARAFAGVSDIITLGLSGPGFYSDVFPEYVWQSPWVPEDEEDIMLMNEPIE